jgi:hypothetical protein
MCFVDVNININVAIGLVAVFVRTPFDQGAVAMTGPAAARTAPTPPRLAQSPRAPVGSYIVRVVARVTVPFKGVAIGVILGWSIR